MSTVTDAVSLANNPLLNEQLIGLAAVAARIPSYRGGRPTNPSTAFRWMRDGVMLPDGTRLRLEGFRLVSRWVSSVEAVDRFLAKVAAANAPVDGSADAPRASRPASASARQQRADRASAELRKMGA